MLRLTSASMVTSSSLSVIREILDCLILSGVSASDSSALESPPSLDGGVRGAGGGWSSAISSACLLFFMNIVSTNNQDWNPPWLTTAEQLILTVPSPLNITILYRFCDDTITLLYREHGHNDEKFTAGSHWYYDLFKLILNYWTVSSKF